MLLNLFAVVEVVFRHPLMTGLALLLVTTCGAYRFGEQWQRQRQRRDYKYQALVRFTSLSSEALTGLSHILAVRGKIDESKRQELAIQYLSRRSILLGMDGEFVGVYGDGDDDQLIHDLVYLKNLMHQMQLMAFAAPPTPQSVFQAVQHRFTAHRRVMIARMARATDFITKGKERAILEELIPQARDRESLDSTTP